MFVVDKQTFLESFVNHYIGQCLFLTIMITNTNHLWITILVNNFFLLLHDNRFITMVILYLMQQYIQLSLFIILFHLSHLSIYYQFFFLLSFLFIHLLYLICLFVSNSFLFSFSFIHLHNLIIHLLSILSTIPMSFLTLALFHLSISCIYLSITNYSSYSHTFTLSHYLFITNSFPYSHYLFIGSLKAHNASPHFNRGVHLVPIILTCAIANLIGEFGLSVLHT